MVELIVAIVAFVITLGVLFGVPRVVGSDVGNGGQAGTAYRWPDVLGGLDDLTDRWLALPGVADIAAVVLTLIVVAAGISLHLDPGMLGIDGVGFVLLVLGLGLLGAVSYLRTKRSGISNAEATLISMSITGTALTILVLYVLIAGS